MPDRPEPMCPLGQIAEKLLGYHHYVSARDLADSSRKLWQRYGGFRDFRVLGVEEQWNENVR